MMESYRIGGWDWSTARITERMNHVYFFEEEYYNL